jgi:hypothetical protein
LEAKFLEEVGDDQPTSRLYKPGLFEAMREQSEQSYAEEKPSQSHFDAEKLLRWKRCQIISGSFGRPFCMSFSLQGSRDLGEEDQISLVSIWHCSRCTFENLNRNKEASPTETKGRRCRQSCVELRYQSACYGLLFILLFQIYKCVFGCHNSSSFLILLLSFSNG